MHSIDQDKHTQHSSETDTQFLRSNTHTVSMHMEPGSMQVGVGDGDGDGAVNMTSAMEAFCPWLKHPRHTIIKVEALVLGAAGLLLFQLILGSCRRRWHNPFIKYGLQVCDGIMFPLTVYTLGTMQSSPVKNASYPVWAGFLIMASAGTTAVRQYDFYGSYYNKYMQVMGEYLRDFFYMMMFALLLDPNRYNLKTAWHLLTGHGKQSKASSYCVISLVGVFAFTKLFESIYLVFVGYFKQERSAFIRIVKIICRTQHPAAETSTEGTTANDDGASDFDPHSIRGYKYTVYYCLCGGGLLTIDQIWDCYDGNSSEADANALKDLCLSCALSQRLWRQQYLGIVSAKTSRLKDHDFVFKKLLPSDSEVDFQRAFRVIEVELGFCYDFFFTKYYYTFFWTNFLPVPLIQSLVLLKIILILVVGVLAIRKSLVLETPNPIIQVPISEADYITTVLVLIIALLVELVQAAFYLASNWAQVSLVCMHVNKKCCRGAYIFGKLIGLLRWLRISRQLRNKIGQHSVIFMPKQQPDTVISGAMKKAIATSLRLMYANNPTTNEEISARWQNQMFGEYSWAEDFSQLEVILIWHIATEYCNAISDDDPNDGNGTTRNSGHRGVAVHLSRYCAYLIGSVPELLPYPEVDIAKFAQEVMEERSELFPSSCYGLPEIYNTMKSLPGTQEEDDPTTMFKKGVKLGKQLERKADRWEVLQEFWAMKIIQAAASHYTTKQHMKHLENGGEFLTQIWVLLAHAGILSLNRNKDQEGQTNLESGPSAAA